VLPARAIDIAAETQKRFMISRFLNN